MRRVTLLLACLIALDGRATTQSAFVATLTVPGRASATPSIAADGSRVAVVWSAREASGSTDIYVTTSTDGGRTFGDPVRVNDEPGRVRASGEMPPRVAFAGPAIDVVWVSRGASTTIRVARSDDQGRSFAPSRELQQSGAVGDRGWPALSTDARGGVHALWLDHRGLADPSGANHVHGAARDPAEKRDGVAIAQKSALYYAGRGAEHEIAKGVCYCCKTAVATTPDGTIFAAWRHVFAGNIRDIAFTSSRDGGRTFAPFVRVSEDQWQLDGCPDDGPALAVDDRGVGHVVWPTVVAKPEPHKAIFYASTRDGRTFTPRVRVSGERRNAAHPQIALDPQRRPFVVWDEVDEGQRKLFISHKDSTGFRPPVSIGIPISAYYPAIARSNERLLIASTEGRSPDSVIRVDQVWLPR